MTPMSSLRVPRTSLESSFDSSSLSVFDTRTAQPDTRRRLQFTMSTILSHKRLDYPCLRT